MRAVIQRTTKASVTINQERVVSIDKGIVVLLGIENDDNQEDIEWLSRKITNLRIFEDDNGVMNQSIIDNSGDIILVSQFTLHASTKKGNRPSYIKAARPDLAISIYEAFKGQLEKDLGKVIQTGTFGANMQVELINDGPVTIIIDTKQRE
jgi:D-tyrosyl-tRNA(Tyr) deacylase